MTQGLATVTVSAKCGHPHKVVLFDRDQAARIVREGTVLCGSVACQDAWMLGAEFEGISRHSR